MHSAPHSALCAFDHAADARQARDRLLRAGFAAGDVHIEHGDAPSAGAASAGPQDDAGVLSAVGRFLAGLLGRDAASHAWARHLDQGRWLLVVDAPDAVEAERACALLRAGPGVDAQVVHRGGQRRLRELLLPPGVPAGMADRERPVYESWSDSAALAREHAAAAHRLDPTTGPVLRDPDLGRAPGLRYGDHDKPKG